VAKNFVNRIATMLMEIFQLMLRKIAKFSSGYISGNACINETRKISFLFFAAKSPSNSAAKGVSILPEIVQLRSQQT
jgi:hypothetical protein